MKVLVALKPTSPRRADDVWSAIASEVVVAPFVCPEPDCVCDRVHQGVMSHGYSTEATVRDMDVVPSTLVAACRTHLAATQWAAVVEHPDELDLLVADLVDGMSETAANYPIGTVLRMKFDRRSDRWRYAAVSRRMVG